MSFFGRGGRGGRSGRGGRVVHDDRIHIVPVLDSLDPAGQAFLQFFASRSIQERLLHCSLRHVNRIHTRLLHLSGNLPNMEVEEFTLFLQIGMIPIRSGRLTLDEFTEIHPEYRQIFVSLHGVYTNLLETVPEAPTNVIFLSQACFVGVWLNSAASCFRRSCFRRHTTPNHDMPLSHVHRYAPFTFIRVTQEYVDHFNRTYGLALPRVREAHGHSKVGSTKAAAMSGFSACLPGMHDVCGMMGLTPKDRRWVVHSATRRKACELPIGEQPFATVMREFLKDRTLSFSIGAASPSPQVHSVEVTMMCPNDHSVCGAAKKAKAATAAAAAAADDAEAFEAEEAFEEAFEEMMEQPDAKPIPCGKCIFLTELLWRCRPQMKEGFKTVQLSQAEQQECKLLYVEILREHSLTAFPDKKIVFCPNEACDGQYGLVSDNTLNAHCPSCTQDFCTVCNVQQRHAADGSYCRAEVVSRLEQLGPGTSICPTYPRCQNPIFRDGGCDKVTCSCGATMCWECKKMTALQRTDLDNIQTFFAELGRPIVYGGDGVGFLYFHADDTCRNAEQVSVFRKLTDLPRYVSDFVFYAGGHPLNDGDCQIVFQMLVDAIKVNHP